MMLMVCIWMDLNYLMIESDACVSYKYQWYTLQRVLHFGHIECNQISTKISAESIQCFANVRFNLLIAKNVFFNIPNEK